MPFWAAMCSGVQPLVSVMFGLAPALIRSLMISTAWLYGLAAAAWSGVQPLGPLRFTLAPPAISDLTFSHCPFSAAECRALKFWMSHGLGTGTLAIAVP